MPESREGALQIASRGGAEGLEATHTISLTGYDPMRTGVCLKAAKAPCTVHREGGWLRASTPHHLLLQFRLPFVVQIVAPPYRITALAQAIHQPLFRQFGFSVGVDPLVVRI